MASKNVIRIGGSLALFVGFAALIWFAVVKPLNEWRNDALTTRAQLFEEMEHVQDRISRLEREREQFADDTELDVLWKAAQTGAATALIQSELSRMASESGVSLRSISPIRAQDMELAQAAGFRLEMEAALDQLSSFLRDIEYHSPSLLVERASLRRLNKLNIGQPQPLIFAQIEVLAPVKLAEEPSQ